MNNIMLDLETLGNKPGCIIVSIGAVQFGNGQLGREFYRRISIEDSQRHGLTIDASTVMWWLGQSAEARRELTQPGEPLPVVLLEFNDWYRSMLDVRGKGLTVWGNGSDFDNAILGEAYRIKGMPTPWHFTRNRCYRTIKAVYPDVKLRIDDDKKHNALEDAKAQAEHLMRMIPEI